MMLRRRTYGAIRRRARFQDESVLRPTETFTAVGYPPRFSRHHFVFQFSQGPQVP